MAKKITSSKQSTRKDPISIILFIAMGIIALVVIGYAFIVILNPTKYDCFSDLNTTDSASFLTLTGNSDKEYYVYIYRKNTSKHEMLEDFLVYYANYANSKENERQLYVLDYGIDYGDVLKSELSLTEDDLDSKLPMLVLVKNGRISGSKKTTVSNIKTELETSMTD